MKKRIAILGSTGSIGQQALNVIRNHADLFEVEVLTAHSNYERLVQQAIEFRPNTVVITNKNHYSKIQEALSAYDIKVFAGDKSMTDVMEMSTIDMVLTAVVGFAGLRPTLRAIEYGKTIALANKETMVVAGKMVTDLAREKGVAILPVDSEHSAIFQSLVGETFNPIHKIFLTASGGPFYGKKVDFLRNVTLSDALKHPNWSMGRKITIDSSTLVNKGLEVIEAKWLFDVTLDQIQVIVHPQSIIHSMVQFRDGGIMAQLGTPDMKLPIQYALYYPDRMPMGGKRVDFYDLAQITFEKPDMDTFRGLKLAYEASAIGGSMPTVYNAANEKAVSLFLDKKISYLQITEFIEAAMNNHKMVEAPTVEQILAAEAESHDFVCRAAGL